MLLKRTDQKDILLFFCERASVEASSSKVNCFAGGRNALSGESDAMPSWTKRDRGRQIQR